MAEVAVAYEERYWYPDDGGAVWVAGYAVVDPASGRYLARDDRALAARGLVVAGVAGAAHAERESLQSDELAPGNVLTLRREPANAHDPNAIAVLASGGAQIGWVARGLAQRLAAELDGGARWSAVVLRERRASPRHPRSGLTMLLARAETITLHDRARR